MDLCTMLPVERKNPRITRGPTGIRQLSVHLSSLQSCAPLPPLADCLHSSTRLAVLDRVPLLVATIVLRVVPRRTDGLLRWIRVLNVASRTQ